MTTLTRKERQKQRARFLTAINRRINEQYLCVHQGLFDIAGRCIYIVDLTDPKGILLHLVSTNSLPGASRLMISNRDLYACNSYWGRIEKTGNQWLLKRETRIKDSLTVGSSSTLLSIPLADLGLSFLPEHIREMFMDYQLNLEDASHE